MNLMQLGWSGGRSTRRSEEEEEARASVGITVAAEDARDQPPLNAAAAAAADRSARGSVRGSVVSDTRSHRESTYDV